MRTHHAPGKCPSQASVGRREETSREINRETSRESHDKVRLATTSWEASGETSGRQAVTRSKSATTSKEMRR